MSADAINRREVSLEAAEEELRAAVVPDYLIGFGKALDAALGGIADGWAYFLSKPWKWSPEYQAWCLAGYPEFTDDPGWDEFCDALEQIA